MSAKPQKTKTSQRSKDALWRCPTCKRTFAKRNQAHSCKPVSLESHFKGKGAELRALFDDLCAKLRTCGPLRTDAVKSSINLVAKHHFGGVRVANDGLRLGFILNHPIAHARILLTERITPTVYGHHVKITRAEHLDAELLAWLHEAFQRSS